MQLKYEERLKLVGNQLADITAQRDQLQLHVQSLNSKHAQYSDQMQQTIQKLQFEYVPVYVDSMTIIALRSIKTLKKLLQNPLLNLMVKLIVCGKKTRLC